MRYIIIAALGLSLVACNSNTTENKKTEVAAPKPAPVSKLDSAGTTKLMAVMDAYYSFKNALVKDQAKELPAIAETFSTSAQSFRELIAKDSMMLQQINVQLDTIVNYSAQIKTLYPEGIVEKARIPFEKVSDNLFALLKKVEMKHAGIYRQHCPMAFNDKGAYWLSEEEEIKNPYFGKKMLECGDVTDSL